MTITKAIEKGRSETTMYRFDRQWIVECFDAEMQMWGQGHPTSYDKARRDYSDSIVSEALTALGMTDEDTMRFSFGDDRDHPGSIRERVKAAKASEQTISDLHDWARDRHGAQETEGEFAERLYKETPVTDPDDQTYT